MTNNEAKVKIVGYVATATAVVLVFSAMVISRSLTDREHYNNRIDHSSCKVVCGVEMVESVSENECVCRPLDDYMYE
jgi:hypothetical protein